MFDNVDQSLVDLMYNCLMHPILPRRSFYKNAYKLLILKTSTLYEITVFQRLDEILCAEFQRDNLKFPSRYLIHTMKDVYLIQI